MLPILVFPLVTWNVTVPSFTVPLVGVTVAVNGTFWAEVLKEAFAFAAAVVVATALPASVTVNVPLEVKVWIVFPPEEVIVPPVALIAPVV